MLSLTKIPLDAGNSSRRSYILVLIPKTVKKVITRGQSAWSEIHHRRPSETKRGTLNDDWFKQWLVGIVDGDGSFTITCSGDRSRSNNKWTLEFKVGQTRYNLRLLYHIKSCLGVGTVSVDSKNNRARYRLRNVKHIIEFRLPIFDTFYLRTSKYYHYNLFKQAAFILNDKNLTRERKNRQLTNLQEAKCIPNNYVSPAWKNVNIDSLSKIDVGDIISKPWLVGFTEAEGSFFIRAKDSTRYTHGFTITQKLDLVVLIAISLILSIPLVKYKTYRAVTTTNSSSISFIIDYYTNTMKGIKSLEFRIWARSFNKQSTGAKRFHYLSQVQRQMRTIRSIRLDKNFNVSHYRPIRSFRV